MRFFLPFHGGNMGPNPVRVIDKKYRDFDRKRQNAVLFYLICDFAICKKRHKTT